MIDTVSPVAICQDITLHLDAMGMASIMPDTIDNGSNDACGIMTLALDSMDFDCSEVGPNTVTLTVTDVNGNSSTCTGMVEVLDTVSPMAVCRDIDLYLDASGMASTVPDSIDGGSTDACGIASLMLDSTDFECSEVGMNTVTLTVTDVNGNSSTCTGMVNVLDTVPPMAICQDITIEVDSMGMASIMPDSIDNGSNDACGIMSLMLDTSNFDCSDLGANPVILTVVDSNSNSSTCMATVTVEDNIAPLITCVMNDTLYFDDMGWLLSKWIHSSFQ